MLTGIKKNALKMMKAKTSHHVFTEWQALCCAPTTNLLFIPCPLPQSGFIIMGCFFLFCARPSKGVPHETSQNLLTSLICTRVFKRSDATLVSETGRIGWLGWAWGEEAHRLCITQGSHFTENAYCAILFCAVLCCTVLYNSVKYCTIL